MTDLVIARSNKVAARIKSKPRRAQLQAVRRLVLRAEQRDEVRITKRLSGDIYVRLDALESLLPADAETVTRLEVAVVDVARDAKQIWKHVGAHGSRLLEHEKRIDILEEEHEVLSECVSKLTAIRSRAKVAS